MTRPSEPLLRWLRQQMDARGDNTATVAAKLGRPRGEVRRLLTGAEPMLVDDLLAITQALDLTPEDLGVGGGAPPEEDEAPEAPEGAHWGNQPEALFRLGFELGIDFVFVADVAQLVGWGGPEDVLSGYEGRGLPIKCDAEVHHHMNPAYDARGVTLALVFGSTLHRCTFPWRCIQQVMFRPYPPADPQERNETPKGPPHLRLVT